MTIHIIGAVTINGNVYINDEKESEISKAKDQLLNILFYKRNSDSWGGRDGWVEMLDLYFKGAYEMLYEHIEGFSESKSKDAALSCLRPIIANNLFSWQKGK